MSTAKENRPYTVQSYLFFDGRCEEALEFYRNTLGAEDITMMRFKESPDPKACGPVSGDKIMHACFRIGGSTLMASDGRCENRTKFEGFALSLNAPNDAEAERLFGLLADGGQVQMSMAKTFFASRFGMVADRFGVSWMVIVPNC